MDPSVLAASPSGVSVVHPLGHRELTGEQRFFNADTTASHKDRLEKEGKLRCPSSLASE